MRSDWNCNFMYMNSFPSIICSTHSYTVAFQQLQSLDVNIYNKMAQTLGSKSDQILD